MDLEMHDRITAELEKIAFAEIGGDVKVGDKLRALDALLSIIRRDAAPLLPAETLIIDREYV